MAGYIGLEPIPRATRTLTEGVFSSDTTSLSIPGGFEVGQIAVYLDGLKLRTGEYTGNLDGTIDFLETIPAGTAYVVEEITSFNQANHYTKDEANELFGQSVSSVSTLRGSSFPANLERLWLSESGLKGELYRNGSGFTSGDDDGLNNYVDNDGVKWTRVVPVFASGFGRPMFSTQDVDVSVGTSGDYTTIQEALNNCPVLLNHDYIVRPEAGDYTSEGTLRVPFLLSPRAMEDGSVTTESGHIRRINILGQGTNPEDTKVASIYFSGGIGETVLDNIKFFDSVESKYSNENVHVDVNGGYSVIINAVDFENDTAGVGSGSSSEMAACVQAYGSDVTWKGPSVVTGNTDGYRWLGKAKRHGDMDISGENGSISGGDINDSIVRVEHGWIGYERSNVSVSGSFGVPSVTHGALAIEYDLGSLSGKTLYGIDDLPTSDYIKSSESLSDGSTSISAGSTFTPNAGFYNFLDESDLIVLEIFVSGSWRTAAQSFSGALYCDGTNVRFRNTDGSNSHVLRRQEIKLA